MTGSNNNRRDGATRRERRAWVCLKCDPPHRIFLLPGEPDRPAPRCDRHGPMSRQANKRYVSKKKGVK